MRGEPCDDELLDAELEEEAVRIEEDRLRIAAHFRPLVEEAWEQYWWCVEKEPKVE